MGFPRSDSSGKVRMLLLGNKKLQIQLCLLMYSQRFVPWKSSLYSQTEQPSSSLFQAPKMQHLQASQMEVTTVKEHHGPVPPLSLEDLSKWGLFDVNFRHLCHDPNIVFFLINCDDGPVINLCKSFKIYCISNFSILLLGNNLHKYKSCFVKQGFSLSSTHTGFSHFSVVSHTRK